MLIIKTGKPRSLAALNQCMLPIKFAQFSDKHLRFPTKGLMGGAVRPPTPPVGAGSGMLVTLAYRINGSQGMRIIGGLEMVPYTNNPRGWNNNRGWGWFFIIRQTNESTFNKFT